MNDKLDKQYFDVNFDFQDSKYEPIKNIGIYSYENYEKQKINFV